MEEVWKQIENYPNYYISNLGRVKIKYEEILKPVTCAHGYKVATLYNSGKDKRNVKVHKLVAEAFIDNPDNLPVVNHKDCNQLNNIVDNLEWCTYKENSQHALNNNRYHTEFRHHECKFSEAQLRLIPRLLELGFRFTEIANMFKVSRKSIYCIVEGKSYKSLKLTFPPQIEVDTIIITDREYNSIKLLVDNTVLTNLITKGRLVV